jgi:ribulose-phosphate 3-epimerase
MIDVVPAIMPQSLEDLETKVSLYEGVVQYVQVDVMDGELTPEASFPFIEGDNALRQIGAVCSKADLPFSLDLMIKDVEKHLDNILASGADGVIFHHYSSSHLGDVLLEAKEKAGLEVTLALRSTDTYESVKSLLSLVDGVQFMGIEKVGFQGQPFDERVLENIRDFAKNYGGIISVDGGVSRETAGRLADAGVHRFVIGSALMNVENLDGELAYYRTLNE